jgi:hypothetical protein
MPSNLFPLLASIENPDAYLRYREREQKVLKELKTNGNVSEQTLESYEQAEMVILTILRFVGHTKICGHMAMGGHGLPKVSLGPAMLDSSTPCRWSPLKQPYGCFKDAWWPPAGQAACGRLLSPWTPYTLTQPKG